MSSRDIARRPQPTRLREAVRSATFALVHGGGDVGRSWHLVEQALRRLGHDVVAPDLACDDATATLWGDADTVVMAIGDREDVVAVGHSYGAFTAPLVADRTAVPSSSSSPAWVAAPGERPAEWWANTGYREAVEEQARRDGGLTGHDDPYISFYHDLPRALAEEAMNRSRRESEAAYDRTVAAGRAQANGQERSPGDG